MDRGGPGGPARRPVSGRVVSGGRRATARNLHGERRRVLAREVGQPVAAGLNDERTGRVQGIGLADPERRQRLIVAL